MKKSTKKSAQTTYHTLFSGRHQQSSHDVPHTNHQINSTTLPLCMRTATLPSAYEYNTMIGLEQHGRREGAVADYGSSDFLLLDFFAVCPSPRPPRSSCCASPPPLVDFLFFFFFFFKLVDVWVEGSCPSNQHLRGRRLRGTISSSFLPFDLG